MEGEKDRWNDEMMEEMMAWWKEERKEGWINGNREGWKNERMNWKN